VQRRTVTLLLILTMLSQILIDAPVFSVSQVAMPLTATGLVPAKAQAIGRE
jgi:hypothetical protein